MKLFVRSLPSWAKPADVFVLLFADQPRAFWIDREHHPTAAFSVLGAAEKFERQTAANFGRLRELIKGLAAPETILGGQPRLPFDFRPGLVGFLEYEGAAEFLVVDRALVFDHATNVTYFLGNFEQESDFDAWYHAALLRLALVGGQHASYEFRHRRAGAAGLVSARLSRDEYLERIHAAQAEISAGQVYQLCLTNRLEFALDADPLAVFLALRRSNPAPYSAFYRRDELSVICTSPEQFLTVDSKRVATSRPIKGTRPRLTDKTADEVQAAELANHPKERAENLMIVDLIRNDLSRVCDPDSVAVPGLFEVESYATVHQLVSTVQGKLSPQSDSIDALVSLFPGGSMTGAPKNRAIELLRDFEEGPRGVYSGVIGWLGCNDTADFGMVIRSIVLEAGNAYIGIGGGITSDSEPESEYEETQLKAMALLGAVGKSAW